MHKELKRAIITWLLDNENEFQRINACSEKFKLYIYDPTGNYLIGGKEVHEFIKEANKLLYSK